MKKLFIVYLGGKLKPGRMGEDHEVVMVAADDLLQAKKQAKLKWQGESIDVHIDYVTELNEVDGYAIELKEIKPGEVSAPSVTHESYDPL